MAIAVIGGRPTCGISGTSRIALRMLATLNIAGDSAGTKNRLSEFSMPMNAAAIAISVRKGSMILVSRIVSCSLPGYLAVVLGEHRDERFREDEPCADQERSHDEQGIDDAVAQTPCGGAAFAREVPGERRDERGAHRAFREEIAHQVRDAERDVEGVNGITGAEQIRHDLIAHEAKHTARHRGDANDARRSGKSSSRGLCDLSGRNAAGLRIRAGRWCAHGLATRVLHGRAAAGRTDARRCHRVSPGFRCGRSWDVPASAVFFGGGRRRTKKMGPCRWPGDPRWRMEKGGRLFHRD